MNPLSGLVGAIARARRAWYGVPGRQRRLARPVVSIGNLAVGGSGKTPVVARVARILEEAGERPAILSRGYGRRSRAAIVTVSRGDGPLVGVADSGDEPQMLARRLAGAVILVGADRHRAGHVAEAEHDVTVHVLDDGFQHLQLARDVDLVLVSVQDLDDRVLPVGRLRESLETAAAADAVLVPGSDADARKVASGLGAATVFRVATEPEPLRSVGAGAPPGDEHGRRVVAVAGIARPERFLSMLATLGLEVARSFVFDDHHWFDADDVRRIEQGAREAGAELVVTTEKDAVRLEPVLVSGRPGGALAWAFLPIAVRIEPEAAFRDWLLGRLPARTTGAPRAS